jgi:hypothetical protein
MLFHPNALSAAIFTISLLLITNQALAKPQSLSIAPGQSGFGMKTVAGSGRHLSPPRSRIYRVTSRADSGTGTLRECAELREPRVCLFEVAGEISLRTPIKIRNPYITIAGQSAPSPGVTLTHSGIKLETHDVLIQHIAIRPGDYAIGAKPSDRDGISIGVAPPKAARDIVLDHLSISWGIDENLSTWYDTTRDVTITNSIIAEGLHRSIHPKGPHSKGLMIGDKSQRITVTRNLIALNEERNPYIKPGSSSEFINNVVYGWGANGGWSLCNITNNEDNQLPITLTFIGNRYIPGPWSFIADPLYARRISPLSQIHSSDNIITISSASAKERVTSPSSGIPLLHNPPISSNGTTILRNEEAYHLVLNQSGSRPFDRSPIDARIINDVIYGRGSIKDCLSGCSNEVAPRINYPSRTRKLTLPRRPFGDRNRDGYTNLENWLHRLSLTKRADR